MTLGKMYAPSIGAPDIRILIDIKGDINSNAMILGDFNTLLILMDRSSRQKPNKETVTVNETIDQIDLTDVLYNITT